MVRPCACAIILFTALAMSSPAHGDARPPPDVTHGERFDGRVRDRGSARRKLLWIPRVLLAPLRWLLRGVAWLARPPTEAGERHHVVERVLRLFMSRDGLIGVYPTLSYTAGFTPFFGGTFFDRRVIGEGTALQLSLAGADSNNIMTSAWMRPTHELRAVELELAVAYERRNDQLFTGIGLPSQLVNGSRYAHDRVDVGALVDFQPARAVRFTLAGRFGWRRFGNGRLVGDDLPIDEVFCLRNARNVCIPGTVDPRLVPGFHEGTQFVRGSAAVRVDTRDSTFRPSSGVALHLEAQYTHGVGFDESSYVRLHGGIEAALDVWQRSRVLVVRVLTDLLLPTSSAIVPFSELVVIGGHDDLRGARPGRYRDFSSLLMSLEYRWPIWMWMDAQLFADYGGTFGEHFAGFSTRELVPAVGVGLRVRTLSRFFLRVQTAYGFGQANGWQFFVAASTEP
jgi:outer membrane protein assembly factor BamA